MQIYRGHLELLDYVFYATVERGKVYETGPFIHNYALVYGLGLVRSQSYSYARQLQQPHYVEELAPLNELLYLTPAQAVEVSFRLIQWNTLRESYAFPNKAPSLGYPDWGFARVLRPGSRFRCYAWVQDASALPDVPALQALATGRSMRFRLGKFLGKVRLTWEAAAVVEAAQGPFQSEALLNWRDLENDPATCDILSASLPTRLLKNAYFTDGAYYRARFGEEEVLLPAAMRFLARVPTTRRRR